MAGKGSRQRPTDMKKYSDNWDAIFAKKTAIQVEPEVLDVYNEERLVSKFDKEDNKPLDNNN